MMTNTHKILATLSWKLTLSIYLLIVILSLICSVSTNNYDIFASSGAVMTVAGIYMSIRHTILLSSKDEYKLMSNKMGYGLISPDENTDEYAKALKESERILFSERVGFGMSIVGTIIWAYGGYIST